VAATNKSETIGRWDILMNDEHSDSVRKYIAANLDQWITNSPINSARPDDYPPPGIAMHGNTDQEDSSQGDMLYLSSSAGSYDSLMESETDAQYNTAPHQRVRNSVSVLGFSWAQVAARSTITPASRSSHVSELTTPTQTTQAQSIKMTALKTEVSDLKSQLHRFENFIIALTERLQPNPPNCQNQPLYHNNQVYHSNQPGTYHHQQLNNQTTPSRHNGASAAGRGHGGQPNQPESSTSRPTRQTNLTTQLTEARGTIASTTH
jgi:hypothetical protein